MYLDRIDSIIHLNVSKIGLNGKKLLMSFGMICDCGISRSYLLAWVKVFRNIPEFRILRVTFQSHPQNAELRDCISFFDLFSVCPRTTDHFNLKL